MVFTVRRNNFLISSKRLTETFSVFLLESCEFVYFWNGFDPLMSYFFNCYDLLLLGHRQLDYRLEDQDPMPGSRIAG